jgi:hypothetical protein
MKFSSLVFAFAILSVIQTYGQWDSIEKKFNDYRSKALIEKIYVHMDRPYYLTGETVWFKVYKVDGSFHRPNDVSKVVYVELVDLSGTVHIQSKILIDNDGNGVGSFSLSSELRTGNYRVMAYTNWMKNFDQCYYFSEGVEIINPFRSLEGSDVVMNKEYDIQFFPEGGHLVNGQNSRIGFRATDDKGMGFDFSGFIVNSNNDTIVGFKPDRFGLGSFYLKPEKGIKYKGIVKFINSPSIERSMPETLDRGYTMEVKDTINNRIKVTIRGEALTDKEPIYLFVHSKNIISFTGSQNINEGSASFLINKDSVNDGVSHFTAFDQMIRPVCERLYFKKLKNSSTNKIQLNKQVFATREKVNLSIASPEESNISISVYRIDSIRSMEHSNITSHLNLMSDLNTRMERPDYYFSDSVTQVQLDNLMMAHEWRKFKWETIIGSDSLVLDFVVPEIEGHLMKGVVRQKVSGDPIGGINVFGSVPAIAQFKTTTTNEKGEFSFVLDYTGVENIILQTIENNIVIEVVNPLIMRTSTLSHDKFVFSDTQLKELQMRSIHMQVQNVFEQVDKIPAFEKSVITAFYGNPDKVYYLDDYTRFPTMEEVLREYVPEVSVRKNRGKYQIFLRNLETNTPLSGEPLILLNGVPIFDKNKLMELDPLQIDKLEIITRPYYFPNAIFDGVISFSSYSSRKIDSPLDSVMTINYKNYDAPHEFIMPEFEVSTIPDVRHLLYWNPEVNINSNEEVELEFYTSDVAGTYVVKVNGITKQGLPLSNSLMFEVKQKKK